MRKPAPATGLTALALLTAVAATLATGLGDLPAWVAGVLAQPAWALAVRGLQRQALPTPLGGSGLSLLLLSALATLGAALLLAWPLASLLRSGSLSAALGLSLASGVLLIGFWRLWPLWHGLVREGGSLEQHWRELDRLDTSHWHGLLAAALLGTAVAPIVLQGWPRLLADGAHWPVAVALLVVWPAVHVGLQRLPAATQARASALQGLPPTPIEPTPAEASSKPGTVADLYAAARTGRVQRALELLEQGLPADAAPPAGDKDRRSLAVLAAVLPDLRLLRALIGYGVDVNASHGGLTPLLAATRDSWHGRPEAVMTLLTNGADPRITDAEGNTPLHHAARSSDPGVAALLRDAAAEIDVPNHAGVTPLGMACASGNWRLAKFLLERGARAQPPSAAPALLAAAATDEDDPAGVQLLLKHRAQVGAVDAGQRTALHQAALAGHVGIVDALLHAGALVQARDSQGRTPLLDAARSGRIGVVDALLEAGADVQAVDHQQQGVLAHACQSAQASTGLIERLLALGADASATDAQGRTPVALAAEAGRWSLVALMDSSYSLPSRVLDDAREADENGQSSSALPDRSPQSLLHEGLSQDRYEGLDKLAALLHPAELGRLLLDPALLSQPQRLHWLLRHGADVSVRDGNGDGLMFALLRRGPVALPQLRALLEHGHSPAGRGGLAAYLAGAAANLAHSQYDHHAAQALALQLLECGADAFAASAGGESTLVMAVRLGWQRLACALMERGVALDSHDAQGMSALHLAAALGQLEMVQRLVASGAPIHARAADGQTPLGIALASGRRDIADWLQWNGWALPPRRLRASDLPAAASAGDAAAVQRLLSLGFAIDSTDSQGCTALLRAAGGGHAVVAHVLLQRGANSQLAAHSGATPLSAAVSRGHVEVVQTLLAAGAPLEARLPGGITVLLLACALGLPRMAEALLLAGADIDAVDEQQRGCLHCAALYGFAANDRARLLALFDTLLLAGAAPDQAAAGGMTPLLLLLGARAEPGSACNEAVVVAALQRLLDENVQLDARESRGFGALHLAALHGLMDATRALLRAGADPALRDTLNRPARDIALMRGFVDVAAELALPEGNAPASTNGDVSMARFLRER